MNLQLGRRRSRRAVALDSHLAVGVTHALAVVPLAHLLHACCCRRPLCAQRTLPPLPRAVARRARVLRR